MSAGIIVLILVVVALVALVGFWLVRNGGLALPGRGPSGVKINAADRTYLQDTWKHVQGVFVDNPEVALQMAHNTVFSVMESHGADTSDLPGMVPEGQAATTEDIRLRLVRYEAVVNELTGAAPKR